MTQPQYWLSIIKEILLELCSLCPRNCKADRDENLGFCRSKNTLRIARAALHFGEEPCICGKNGSGTVFFTGCTLKCVYCQNREISRENVGCDISCERLCEIFLTLQDKGADNINLVTATHYVPLIIKALDMAKPRLHIPIVYNTGGYETKQTIDMLDGYVDVYLTDIKYKSSEASLKYSGAADYFEYTSKAALQMINQVGVPQFKDGIMKKGVIIRHLVLPTQRRDSMDVLSWISQNLPKDSYLLSLMSQYTPIGLDPDKFKEINRRVTSFEYNSVVDYACELGITQGFIQDKSSADSSYIPAFSSEIDC